MGEVLSQNTVSVHATITEKIVAMVEAGAGTYKAPWHAPGAGNLGIPVNAVTHAPYRGVNVLSLWVDALTRGYASGFWASYRQWQSIGAQVRKGEHGCVVVFYKRVEGKPCDEEDHDQKRDLRFVARASRIFNAAQVDGFVSDEPERAPEFQRIAEIEAFVEAIRPTVQHGSPIACYRPKEDVIEMPHREWFLPSDTGSAEENYYAILMHELTHWVGAPHRLNRTFGRRFGDAAYAMEELVAELGAAFLCAALGISSEPRPDHAAYVSSWLAVLNRDKKAIFTAASKAQEAFDHLAHLATRPDGT